MARFQIALTTLFVLASCATVRSEENSGVARGEYLVKIMHCGGCHTPGALAGRPDFTRALGGSDTGIRVPGVGIVYAPNLTSDPETGLKQWSDEQIIRALKYGERPDGRRLVPVMPWPSYSGLNDADAAALVAYLRTLPAIRTGAPANSREGQRPPAPYLEVVVPR